VRSNLANYQSILRSLREHPGYSLMRGMARFAAVRHGVTAARQMMQARLLDRYLAECDARMKTSVFANLDCDSFVHAMNENGVALGLHLPSNVLDEVYTYATQNPCYADRNPAYGFTLNRRAQAETALSKTILLAQYFNTAENCPAIAMLMRDPMLLAIAGKYLQSLPTLVGVNLWWTFAVDASAEDRDRHAHLFHCDVDDFRFFKFFFYINDVRPGDGAHVCVSSSHHRRPLFRLSDNWNLRRYSDLEIESAYPADRILEICGPAGTGFAENTLCIHKGRTPTFGNRLMLQFQFALFDYGLMHDRCELEKLKHIS
jgi:hypothetical protein